MTYPVTIPKYFKDPQAVLDYLVDWSEWLVEDSITNSTFAVDDAGLTIDSTSFTTTSGTVWLSGGTLGTTYIVTNHITTSGGRQDDHSFRIIIKDK